MLVSFSPLLIILSVGIAIISSYTALVLVERIAEPARTKRMLWVFFASLIMGMGIFSMHFIGMIALHFNTPLSYDPVLLFASLMAAITASFVAFYILLLKIVSRANVIVSGLVMGIAISLMHYIGILSQVEFAVFEFNLFYFILSLVIALVFSSTALKILFEAKKSHLQVGRKLGSAAVLGITISLVHYTGMKAVYYAPHVHEETARGIDSTLLVYIISLAVFIILAVAIFTTFLDFQSLKKEQELLAKMKESEERFRRLIEVSPEAIVIHSGKEIVFVNEACMSMINRTDKAELIGKAITDYVHPVFQGVVQERIHDMKQGLKGKPMEQQLLTPDGTFKDVEISGIGIEFEGKPAIQLILRDITEQKKTRRELQKSQQLYSSLFDYNPDVVYSMDLGGRITNVNRSIQNIMGYSEEEFLAMKFTEVIADQDLMATRQYFEQAIQGYPQNYEVVCIHKEGYPMPLNITNLPIIVDGETIGVFGIAKDISNEKKALRLLEANEEKYRSLFEHNLDAIFEIDMDGSYKNVNKKAEELIHFSKEELYGMSFPTLILEDLKGVYKSFLQVKKGQSLYVEQKLKDRYGNILEVDVSAVPIRKHGKVDGVFSIVRDVTEKKQTQKKIQELAFTDHLTGLPNRHWFYENVKDIVQKAKRQNHTVAILLLDFDNFKGVNDLLGHHGGDLFLRDVSRRVQSCLQINDKISRLGGDEFIILLENVTEDYVEQMARQILNEMNRPIFLLEHKILATLSIGISMNTGCASDDEELIRQADIAMYSAKEKGKNNYQFFTENLNEKITRKLQLENALRKAIVSQEFQLYYQPQIELQTGKLIGFEALIRWHSSFGIVAPSEFIPLAEETGLIVPIGEWVIEQACRQIKVWESQRLPKVKVSVNVSARQFRDMHFSEKVQEILSRQNVDPQYFEIEITESVMLDIEESSKLIEDLKRLGVKVAIDDFGAGYSSLNVIKNVEIDTLKIDKSLIDEVIDNPRHMSILTAIIEVGVSLQTQVVVEGIETRNQVDVLKKFNVIGQGYFFSRPYPPEKLFYAWEKDWIPEE